MYETPLPNANIDHLENVDNIYNQYPLLLFHITRFVSCSVRREMILLTPSYCQNLLLVRKNWVMLSRC